MPKAAIFLTSSQCNIDKAPIDLRHIFPTTDQCEKPHFVGTFGTFESLKAKKYDSVLLEITEFEAASDVGLESYFEEIDIVLSVYC